MTASFLYLADKRGLFGRRNGFLRPIYAQQCPFVLQIWHKWRGADGASSSPAFRQHAHEPAPMGDGQHICLLPDRLLRRACVPDREEARLPGADYIAFVIVSDIPRVFRPQARLLQRQVEDPSVGLAEQVLAAGDDKFECMPGQQGLYPLPDRLAAEGDIADDPCPDAPAPAGTPGILRCPPWASPEPRRPRRSCRSPWPSGTAGCPWIHRDTP